MAEVPSAPSSPLSPGLLDALAGDRLALGAGARGFLAACFGNLSTCTFTLDRALPGSMLHQVFAQCLRSNLGAGVGRGRLLLHPVVDEFSQSILGTVSRAYRFAQVALGLAQHRLERGPSGRRYGTERFSEIADPISARLLDGGCLDFRRNRFSFNRTSTTYRRTGLSHLAFGSFAL